MTRALFTAEQYGVIRFVADECRRQHSGELSVAWMLSAWDYACCRQDRRPDQNDIIHLGQIVEPWVNTGGFRHVSATAGGNIKLAPRLISRAMTSLIEARDRIEPAEFYREFEEIHPFGDGNGRVGSILFNWLRGTLHDPVVPPDFWGAESQTNMEGIPS